MSARTGRPEIPATSGAELIHDAAAVGRAFDAMAAAVDAELAGADCLAVVLLQGGIVPAGNLLPRLRSPLELDSVQLTRYRNTTRGGAIEWRQWLATPVAGRTVLLIDDILDEGHSLAAVAARCHAEGAARVLTAVLVDKRHGRKSPDIRADVVGLEVDDRYVFGFGMDYLGWHRNAPGIFAVVEDS